MLEDVHISVFLVFLDTLRKPDLAYCCTIQALGERATLLGFSQPAGGLSLGVAVSAGQIGSSHNPGWVLGELCVLRPQDSQPMCAFPNTKVLAAHADQAFMADSKELLSVSLFHLV